MLRLARRLLLCLFVGLATFGAAGWLCRPQPTWTVRFGGKTWCSLVNPVSVAKNGPPHVWVLQVDASPSAKPLGPRLIHCIDASRGLLLGRVLKPIDGGVP